MVKVGCGAGASIAPAFHGQFSESVTPGKLRSAFKALGFQGMVEVALFADVLTLKEALEFTRELAEANPGGAYEVRPIGYFIDWSKSA